MNQKDYKEISKIINNEFGEWFLFKKEFVNKLADYFEKQSHSLDSDGVVLNFSKEQFLKDCRVTK